MSGDDWKLNLKTRKVFFLLFLVGAFSLKEKSTTITVGSFFQFTLNGPLF